MTEKETRKVNVNAGRVAPRGTDNTYAPLVDIHETKDGTTVLQAEMPGARPDSIDVRVEKGVLTIAGESAPPPFAEPYARTYMSFEGGSYFRAFALSDEVDRDKIEAAYADGVLTLRLPRAQAAKTRKIQIK